MAQSNDNPITQGLSGMLGDQLVFRQRHGKTVVAQAPKPSDKPLTAAQQAHLDRFQQAVRMAKKAVSDPVRKAELASRAQPGQSAYHVAVAEAYQALHSGAEQLVRADNPAVEDGSVAPRPVRIRIEAGNGNILAEGEAVFQPDSETYVYTPAGLAALSGCTIVVSTIDRLMDGTV